MFTLVMPAAALPQIRPSLKMLSTNSSSSSQMRLFVRDRARFSRIRIAFCFIMLTSCLPVRALGVVGHIILTKSTVRKSLPQEAPRQRIMFRQAPRLTNATIISCLTPFKLTASCILTLPSMPNHGFLPASVLPVTGRGSYLIVSALTGESKGK